MNKKLRIGLLLDSYNIHAWEFAIIKRLMDSEYANIELIVHNDGKRKYSSDLSRLRKNLKKILYHIYMNIDKKLFKCRPDALEIKDAKPHLSEVSVIKIKPIRKKFSDYFNEDDIKKIRAFGIDVFIRMGFRILRGSILNVSRFGIWSYHHADNSINRGGPPGFWEAVDNWPVTGSILQIINEDLDNGNVIYKSYSRTIKYSPSKNYNLNLWKSVSFIPRKLEELQRVGEKKFFEKINNCTSNISFYSNKLYKAPHNILSIKIIFRQFFKITRLFFFKIFIRRQWLLLFSLNKDISTSLQKFKKIMPPKDRFWADPHVIFKDDKYYIFIEELMYKTAKGHISLIIMDKKGNYTGSSKIINKKYHLSYPFVFEFEEKHYMIPETSENRTIELYECVDFPKKWKFFMNLMKDIYAIDTTLFFYKNKWWLFTNIIENQGACPDDELFLFYSNNLFSKKWVSHPLNPIVTDVKCARQAGKIFTRNGKIYRPSQNNVKSYGSAININQISILHETNYQERKISSIEPNWDNKIRGAHTFNCEENLTIIDGYMRRLKFIIS